MSDTGGSFSAASSGYSGDPNSGTYGPAFMGTASTQASTHNYGQALTLVSGLTKAWSQNQAGEANNATAKYNASRARIQEGQALEEGNAAKAQREAEFRLTQGSTRAGYADQGVIVGAGTSREVMRQQARANAIDQQRIELNARRQAYGHELIALDQERRGGMEALAGKTEAISTLVGTASRYRAEEDSSYHGTRFST